MYITIIICVLLICATVLGYRYLQIGFETDETMKAKFDAAMIEINSIIAKDDEAEAKDKSYMCQKDDYRDCITKIKQILES